MPGRRLASIDLPVPGAPIIRTLWPPAAATTMARRAISCPSTSAKSGQASGPLSGTKGMASVGRMVVSPSSASTTWLTV